MNISINKLKDLVKTLVRSYFKDPVVLPKYFVDNAFLAHWTGDIPMAAAILDGELAGYVIVNTQLIDLLPNDIFHAVLLHEKGHLVNAESHKQRILMARVLNSPDYTLLNEYEADDYVVSCGYGKEMKQALKLLLSSSVDKLSQQEIDGITKRITRL